MAQKKWLRNVYVPEWDHIIWYRVYVYQACAGDNSYSVTTRSYDMIRTTGMIWYEYDVRIIYLLRDTCVHMYLVLLYGVECWSVVCDDVPGLQRRQRRFFFMSMFCLSFRNFFRFHPVSSKFHLVFLFMVENKREPAAFLFHTLAAPTDELL